MIHKRYLANRHAPHLLAGTENENENVQLCYSIVNEFTFPSASDSSESISKASEKKRVYYPYVCRM